MAKAIGFEIRGPEAPHHRFMAHSREDFMTQCEAFVDGLQFFSDDVIDPLADNLENDTPAGETMGDGQPTEAYTSPQGGDESIEAYDRVKAGGDIEPDVDAEKDEHV